MISKPISDRLLLLGAVVRLVFLISIGMLFLAAYIG
jgi:hypothetical protein